MWTYLSTSQTVGREQLDLFWRMWYNWAFSRWWWLIGPCVISQRWNPKHPVFTAKKDWHINIEWVIIAVNVANCKKYVSLPLSGNIIRALLFRTDARTGCRTFTLSNTHQCCSRVAGFELCLLLYVNFYAFKQLESYIIQLCRHPQKQHKPSVTCSPGLALDVVSF